MLTLLKLMRGRLKMVHLRRLTIVELGARMWVAVMRRRIARCRLYRSVRLRSNVVRGTWPLCRARCRVMSLRYAWGSGGLVRHRILRWMCGTFGKRLTLRRARLRTLNMLVTRRRRWLICTWRRLLRVRACSGTQVRVLVVGLTRCNGMTMV